MNKLQLKHLAPYLNYKLKTSVDGDADNDTLLGLHASDATARLYNKELSITYITYISNLTPILRPLSDLTKEIDIEGRKFIPIMDLCDVGRNGIYWSEGGNKKIVDCSVFKGNKVVRHDSYEMYMHFGFKQGKSGSFFYGYDWDFEDDDFAPNNIVKQNELWMKLYEWHFDVLGLIEKGLAVDINTLNS